jgi:hypothetical protein
MKLTEVNGDVNDFKEFGRNRYCDASTCFNGAARVTRLDLIDKGGIYDYGVIRSRRQQTTCLKKWKALIRVKVSKKREIWNKV